MGLINPPVYQIYLVGPKETGIELARNLYPICLERRWLPAFYVSGCLSEGVVKQVASWALRTGVITFGPGAEESYRRLNRKYTGTKVLRLLDAGAPKPKPFFGYEAQIFSFPQGIHDYDAIANWMGIIPYGDGPDFKAVYPDALMEKELVKKEIR